MLSQIERLRQTLKRLQPFTTVNAAAQETQAGMLPLQRRRRATRSEPQRHSFLAQRLACPAKGLRHSKPKGLRPPCLP
jgi:hypothetical protein